MTSDAAPAPPRRLTGALIGLLSIAVFLGAAQLAAIVCGRSTAPVLAIGETFVDHTPAWLKTFAVENFGTNDKTVLIAGIFAVITFVAVVAGVLAMRRPWVGTAGVVTLAVISGLAARGRPDVGVVAPLPALAGAVASIIAFRALRRADMPYGDERHAPSAPDRRRFLVASAVVAATAAVTGFVGGAVTSRRRAAANSSRAAAVIPAVAATTAPATAAQLDVQDLAPFFTPNKDFYRIDTALAVPEIDAEKWSLRIHGMVDREVTLSYADLRAMPAVEHDVTLCCVSNPVGGDLVGNARWTGVLLTDVLAKAGVHPDATQLLSTSADGWTCGTSTAVALDGRASMLAFGQNGEPLALEHGFPVRMVVPGLYGYVSATKWVTDIELTTLEQKGYWITRGWSQNGPVKTMSRIDVPKQHVALRSVPTPIAGVAWAQHKGVAKVEVSIDDGPWLEARLAAEDTTDTWRQWVYDRWMPDKGVHNLRVRATDKTGYVQTGDIADVVPDGATGYHLVTIVVD
ncbi:MAG: Sulfite oxidase-like protein [Frankiales bacterium]|nr:Sulfite oxidase-like protein [Frankiales bacterium]